MRRRGVGSCAWLDLWVVEVMAFRTFRDGSLAGAMALTTYASLDEFSIHNYIKGISTAALIIAPYGIIPRLFKEQLDKANAADKDRSMLCLCIQEFHSKLGPHRG